MTNGSFHENVPILIPLKELYSSGKINRILKSLGATLYYDVYSFDRVDEVPVWQSESYANITLLREGSEVDAQESSDAILLNYPLATIGAEYIEKFADLVEKISVVFSSKAMFGSTQIDKRTIITVFEGFVTELMTEWGEEPGSKALYVMIQSNYGSP